MIACSAGSGENGFRGQCDILSDPSPPPFLSPQQRPGVLFCLGAASPEAAPGKLTEEPPHPSRDGWRERPRATPSPPKGRGLGPSTNPDS